MHALLDIVVLQFDFCLLFRNSDLDIRNYLYVIYCFEFLPAIMITVIISSIMVD